MIHPKSYAQFGAPDQEEGARILREFRGVGIAGDYYLEFDLRILPRRGRESRYSGKLWGSHNAMGPISRVVLHPSGAPQHLLIQNGARPTLWAWKPGQAHPQVEGLAQWFDPIVPESEISFFDLLMPYLYWDDFVFEGVERVRSRPAHVFLLFPPAAVAALRPQLRGVRVYLDTQYHALVQAEFIDATDRVTKTLYVLDIKKVDGQWMVKTIDLRNEQTRDKTRFQVSRAALGLDLSPQLFEPSTLPETVEAPRGLVDMGH